MDAERFDTLVATHHREIYRYLARTTFRTSEADDLAQETFLRAYRAHRTLPPDANARAWLFAIATNVAKNHFRSESRRRRAHAAVRETRNETDGAGPEGETLFNEARALLDTVVAGLPLKQRLAFTLRKVHDLDYDAIARSLDCSPHSARAHVFQALRKIRRSLNGSEFSLGRDERSCASLPCARRSNPSSSPPLSATRTPRLRRASRPTCGPARPAARISRATGRSTAPWARGEGPRRPRKSWWAPASRRASPTSGAARSCIGSFPRRSVPS